MNWWTLFLLGLAASLGVWGCNSPKQAGNSITPAGFSAGKLASRVLQEKGATENEGAAEFAKDARQLVNQGKWREALETYQAALKEEPTSPELWYQLGRCQEKVGQFDQAEHSYRTALSYQADHSPSRHAFIKLLANTSRREDASKLVEGWLASNPKSSAAFAEDGWLYLQNGDLPKAQARLQQALAIDPNEPLALVELGEVYEQLNRPDRALYLYDRALIARPDQPALREKVQRLKSQGIAAPKPD